MLRHRLFPALVLLVAALAVVLAHRVDRAWDWSAGNVNRLHDDSLEVLRALEGPVEIEVFMEALPVRRAAVERLLEKYRRAHPDLAFRFTDPAREPGRARALGIVRTPTLVLRHGDREERIERVDEAAVSSALARLGRRGAGWIGATTGHGERRLHGTGTLDLGDFGRLLEEAGYRIVSLELTSLASLPENLDLLVLAAPETALAPAAEARILRHLERGGRLLWLVGAAPLPALSDALGLALLPGTLVDAAAADHGFDTPTVAVGLPDPDHPVTEALDGPVFLPGAHALEPTDRRDWKARPLLRSGARSWNETGELRGVIRRNPGQGERPGPLTLAWALERNGARVAVVGDADLFSAPFLGRGANRAFGLALVRWLTGNDRLVAVPPRRPPDQQLRWPESRMAAVAALLLFGLPLLLAATGLIVAWRRRRR